MVFHAGYDSSCAYIHANMDTHLGSYNCSELPSFLYMVRQTIQVITTIYNLFWRVLKVFRHNMCNCSDSDIHIIVSAFSVSYQVRVLFHM